MSWLRFDDAMGEHRKTRRLLRKTGMDAFGLHALALLHAGRYMTDGFIEEEFVEETLDDARIKGARRTDITDGLVAVGMWEVTDGGWMIHDYLDHNPSRAESEAAREKQRMTKSEAGKKGAAARWGKQSDASSDSTANGTGMADAIAIHSPVPSRPVPTHSQTPSVSGATSETGMVDAPPLPTLRRMS